MNCFYEMMNYDLIDFNHFMRMAEYKRMELLETFSQLWVHSYMEAENGNALATYIVLKKMLETANQQMVKLLQYAVQG